MIPGVVRGRRGYQNSSVGVGAPEKTSSILLFAPSEAQVGSSNLAARLLEAGLGYSADNKGEAPGRRFTFDVPTANGVC